MRNRAFRRYQEVKKKFWVKKNFDRYYYHGLDDRIIGIRAHSPQSCSCHMCGNERKHWKNRTLQELKFDIDFQEEMLDEEEINFLDQECGPDGKATDC